MTELTGPLAIKATEYFNQMEIVLEVLNEGVVIADEHHRILFANSSLWKRPAFPHKT